MRFICLFIFLIPLLSNCQEVFRNIESTVGRELEVEFLHLSGKKWRSFPEAIRTFENLKSLQIRRAGLKTVPLWIGQLPLEHLSLSKNKLEVVPEGVYQNNELRKLDLGHNYISELSEKISQLEFLEDLNLWGNMIYDLPQGIDQMENLKKIDLRVIDLNRHEQAELKSRFPNVTIEMSPPCNCQ